MRLLLAVAVTAVLLAQSPVRPDLQLPSEAAGWDNVVLLAPVSVRSNGPEAQQLGAALRALEDTLSSPDRPARFRSMHTRAAGLVANPFYLGQAMLSPSTRIGDLDDACVYFGR